MKKKITQLSSTPSAKVSRLHPKKAPLTSAETDGSQVLSVRYDLRLVKYPDGKLVWKD